MKRRTLIQTGLLAAGSAAGAGCLGTGETENGATDSIPTQELPAYSEWIPATPSGSQDGVLFTRQNWETVNRLGNGAEDDEPLDVIEDTPIIGLPLYGLQLSPLVIVGIAFYPFSDVIVPDEQEETDGVETETMTWADSVVVFHGEYDVSVFEQQYADGFEASDVSNGFTLFEGVDEFTDELAFAVSEQTVIVGMQPGEEDEYAPAEEVSATLERAEAERDRVVDQAQWLFEATGDADMTLGVWDTEDLPARVDPETDDSADEPEIDGENPVFGAAESVINTLSVEIQNDEIAQLTARFAGVYPDEVPSEAELRTHLVGEAELPHEIVRDGSQVYVAVTFE